ncbi:hypothetical protein CLV58_12547 [Spirosoma oryzae]|uniref:Acb2/Tad1 hairpin domain-containing protein n=1 Tax=Spirosoma oryzae TaxID=1469603 RepID=A0A2T0S8M9_9BACT|nr:hypothetical protein [Spirosoma oryzae]PRY29785.1 hypothetical protein CLV58_12547 [Spirosoma oryzae]
MEKTIGETRVRTAFNPSANGEVDQIKQKAAELINLIDGMRTEKPGIGGEFGRLKALALTSIEEGAMWAVKAATI